MTVLCALMGRKHYPIPYNWLKIGFYLVAGVGLYLFSLMFAHLSMIPKLAVNTGIILVYLAIWAGMEGFYGKLRKILQQR